MARIKTRTVALEIDPIDPTVTVEMAFGRCDRANGRTNFVKLLDLRQKAGLDRETFDRALRQLRLDGVLAADGIDGRHVRYTDEERAAWIIEAGRELGYVLRKGVMF